MKFYPADWQADELLGMCTLAARGLWLEMIGIMHKADPYGHLVVNGRPPTDTQLAALARCPPDQIPSLLEELENAGVFSRTRTRVIYSRRMTRDERRRKDGETAEKTGSKVPGSRRWQRHEKQRQNTPPPLVVIGVGDQPPNHPDARVQSLDRKKETPSGVSKESRGTRLPRSFHMEDEWIEDGAEARMKHGLPSVDLSLEAAKFCTYWWPKTGSGATKIDWHQTWVNWCLNARCNTAGGRSNGKSQSAGEKLLEGGYRAALAWEERERTRRETDEPLLDIGRPDSDAPGSDRGLD
jgi:hypothetical protein